MSGESWRQEPLRDIVGKWIVGNTPPRTNPEYFIREGGTPWVKAEDVKGGTLYQTAEHLSGKGGKQMRLVPEGAVLVTTAGTIGKVAIAGCPVFCNQAVQALCFREDKVLPLYGLYLLRSQRPLLLQLANSAVIPNVSKAKLQTLPVRYPPLTVQEQMIARMRIPEALCEKAERLQTLLNKYLLALTVREARRARDYLPIGELLAEPPLTGLRTKASPTGNGLPLVNKLSGTGSLLHTLDDCQRVQVSPRQANRCRLLPMDILLRNTVSGGGARGALVGELPEEALVGGNLTRIRVREKFSAPWLLAWLLGPGGDRLYVDGKLQKQLLPQYRVPAPEEPEGFERKFLLYLSLVEKANQFAERAQALTESVLQLVFSESIAVGIAPGSRTDSRLDGSLARLTESMNRFLQEMSDFQRELYRLLLRSEEGQPVHALLKKRRRSSRGRNRAAGIQDALSAFALLEQFGLVERESPQKIPLFPDGAGPWNSAEQYITDHNGQPVLIDTYKPTEDIFGENAYAAGAGEDTEL